MAPENKGLTRREVIFGIGLAALFGCRTSFDAPTERDEKAFEVLRSRNINVPKPTNVKKGLEDLIDGKGVNKYNIEEYKEKLGSNYDAALKLEENNERVQRIILGLDAPLVDLYTRLNGFSDDLRKIEGIEEQDEKVKIFYDSLNQKHKDGVSKTQTDFKDFEAYLRNHS